VYAYNKEFLRKFAGLPATPLERIEGLEQLRALEHGYDILVGIVKHAAVGIDTPEEYRAFVRRDAARGLDA
jgi:3-deoxy-manno-octulosonate cytidylyltransferase (CMP-KDO synthetase)